MLFERFAIDLLKACSKKDPAGRLRLSWDQVDTMMQAAIGRGQKNKARIAASTRLPEGVIAKFEKSKNVCVGSKIVRTSKQPSSFNAGSSILTYTNA